MMEVEGALYQVGSGKFGGLMSTRLGFVALVEASCKGSKGP